MEEETNTEYRSKFLAKKSFDNRDLTGKDFSKAQLQGATFRNSILTDANFSGSDIRGCDFSGAILVNVKFDHCQIGLSQKRFIELLFLSPFGYGESDGDFWMIMERARATPDFSDRPTGPLTNFELVRVIVMSSVGSLVWLAFLLSSFYQTRVAHIEISISPYVIVGIASLAISFLSIKKAWKLIRKLASTSFQNADLSGASFIETIIERADLAGSIRTDLQLD